MKCDVCGKDPALIHIEGVGNFCLDCHNERMAALCGLDHDPYEYPRDIAVTDKDGELHYFRLNHMYFGPMIRWQADERNGDYEIVERGSVDEPASLQIARFHRKIVDSVWNQTLSVSESAWGEHISLEDHGNIDIRYSSEDDGVSFAIDGRPVSLEELGKMLASYEGWTLQYQIREKSDPIVKEDEELVPVRKPEDPEDFDV